MLLYLACTIFGQIGKHFALLLPRYRLLLTVNPKDIACADSSHPNVFYLVIQCLQHAYIVTYSLTYFSHFGIFMYGSDYARLLLISD